MSRDANQTGNHHPVCQRGGYQTLEYRLLLDLTTDVRPPIGEGVLRQPRRPAILQLITKLCPLFLKLRRKTVARRSNVERAVKGDVYKPTGLVVRRTADGLPLYHPDRGPISGPLGQMAAASGKFSNPPPEERSRSACWCRACSRRQAVGSQFGNNF